jgi:hypothetical protein
MTCAGHVFLDQLPNILRIEVSPTEDLLIQQGLFHPAPLSGPEPCIVVLVWTPVGIGNRSESSVVQVPTHKTVDSQEKSPVAVHHGQTCLGDWCAFGKAAKRSTPVILGDPGTHWDSAPQVNGTAAPRGRCLPCEAGAPLENDGRPMVFGGWHHSVINQAARAGGGRTA